MDNYKLYTGRFALVHELEQFGIKPLSVTPNPFDQEKSLWTFPGDEKTAAIAKRHYDELGLPYSRSLSILLTLLGREKADNAAAIDETGTDE